jgi:hypothetical protein
MSARLAFACDHIGPLAYLQPTSAMVRSSHSLCNNVRRIGLKYVVPQNHPERGRSKQQGIV